MNLIIPEKTKELPSPKDNATTPGLVHRLHHPTKQNLTTIVCRLNSVDDIHWDDLPELDVCHLQYADMFSPVLHRLKTIETEEPITLSRYANSASQTIKRWKQRLFQPL